MTIRALSTCASLTLPAVCSLDPNQAAAQQADPKTRTAQSPLVGDRPDFTESTETVHPGRLQLEVGYTFTYDRERETRARTHDVPQMLARIGLDPQLELRIGWDGYTFTDLNHPAETPAGRRVRRNDNIQGANDMTLGFKLKLFDQLGARPHLAVIGQLALPTGSVEFSSRDVDPELKLLWAYDLSDTFSVAGNLNVGVPTEDGHRFVQSAASVSLAAALTDRLGTYVEYFGVYPAADTEDAAHTLNGGFTYLLTDDLQLDLLAGVGLNEQADDFFVGVGFIWRF